ncbi:MAG: nuclear transport factor 2 family protein [Acidimicrobiales bacterium]|nr:nuclear transport factor 2 family protein [Acidimicrobiales bacterium]
MAISYLASFATGQPDAIAAHVHSDFEKIHWSALGESSVGRDTYREQLPEFLKDFKELQYESIDTIAEGDRVVISYVMRALYDGHPIEIPGMLDLVITDGLIRRRIDIFDSLTFLRQIGQA